VLNKQIASALGISEKTVKCMTRDEHDGHSTPRRRQRLVQFESAQAAPPH